MSTEISITTSNALEGYKVRKQLGLVCGITVRSRSIVGNIVGGFISLFGGRSSILQSYVKMPPKKLYN